MSALLDAGAFIALGSGYQPMEGSTSRRSEPPSGIQQSKGRSNRLAVILWGFLSLASQIVR